ncbi:hypothetical protein [Pseudophaeobacter sp.]|uniref:hypothetical protein n=1 Tax=Pseudophaeobacter sp. TaxID=1971739 RepID=UPI0032982AFB
MKFAALFLWLALPIAGYATYQLYGSPNLIWSYEFRAIGARYDLTIPRCYTSCTYVGWGLRTVTLSAQAARCPWERLLKVQG